MNFAARPLKDFTVSLSISAGKETSTLGFTAPEVNRTTLRIVAALIGQGAGIAFGHDWRDDGVMESVHAVVERFHAPIREPHRKPLLINLVVWPDKPHFGERERHRLKETLDIEEVALPPSLSNYTEDRDPARYPYLRSRALTYLRRRLTILSNARICLGGKLSGYSGRYPGIVEEAYLAIRAGQPTFIAGVLGGAARQMISSLTKCNSPNDLCPDVPIAKLYRDPPIYEHRHENNEDSQWSPEVVWETFASIELRGLSAKNKLSIDENRQLFNTQSVDEAIELILTGLGRLAQQKAD